MPLALAPGEAVEASTLPTATIAPGVVAALAWGRGALLERVEMQPGAVYPEQTLAEELIVLVREGTATFTVDGRTLELAKDQVIYLTPGTTRSVTAGASGWKAFEVSRLSDSITSRSRARTRRGRRRRFPDQGRHALDRRRRRREPP